MLPFEIVERGLDSFSVLFHALAFTIKERFAEIAVDRGKRFGDLEAVPGAGEDPPPRGHGHHVDDRGAGPLRQHGNSLVDAVARAARPVHGEIARRPAVDVLDQGFDGRQPAFVAADFGGSIREWARSRTTADRNQ